ncbi:hypothetical protein TNCV_4740681 [Trichonephila clavipes]|nr:hypothetical protein TNCV_4740681 [Trichonephila clavipes]
MYDPSSFANPTPLAQAHISRDVLPRGGTSHRRLSSKISYSKISSEEPSIDEDETISEIFSVYKESPKYKRPILEDMEKAEDWWCRVGRGNAVKTRRVELAVVSWPLPKNYSSRSYESSLDGAASECSNK